MANTTFLVETDTSMIDALMKETEENAKYFNDTTMGVLGAYSKDLDELMKDLRDALTQPDCISDMALERYYADLTNMLYFMGDDIERLSVLADMAKAAAKEVYNNAYLDSSSLKDEKGKSKCTVAENQAAAEKESIYETAVGSIYEHALKALKFKVDGGYEMCNTLRKIISKRMQEQQLSLTQASVDTSKVHTGKLLLEDY